MPPGDYVIGSLNTDATGNQLTVPVDLDGYTHMPPLFFGTYADIGGVEPAGQDFRFSRISDESGNACNLQVSGGGYIPYRVISTGTLQFNGGFPYLYAVKETYEPELSGNCACATCNSNGVCTGSTHSMDVRFGLGKNLSGAGSAFLWIHSDMFSPELLTPSMLGVSNANEVQILTSSSASQVLSAESLANIFVTGSTSYEIDFYHATDAGTTGTDGLYHPTAAPYQADVISGSPPLQNGIVQISESGEVQNGVDVYQYNADSQYVVGTWSFSHASGLASEQYTTTSAVGGPRTETKTVSDPVNGIVSQEAVTYGTFSWGEAVTQYVADPSGKNPLVYTWSYYDSPGYAYNGRVKSMTAPGGYWETYCYNGTSGQIATTCKSQFLDAPFDAPANQCWVTTSTTTLEGSGYYQTAVVQTLMGQEVSRTYTEKGIPNGTINTFTYECQHAGAAEDDPTNITSSSVTNPMYGPFPYQPLSVSNPDGTISLTTYSGTNGTNKTITTLAGAPSSDGSTVVDGSKTVAVTDAADHPISTQVTDISSGLVTSYDLWDEPDDFGRPTRVTHLDGTTEITVRGCCNIQSYTDRFGTTTTYNTDGLNRIISKTTAGITYNYTYDGAGRLLQTTRRGTDGSVMPQSQTSYDLAGRVWQTRDALNRATYIKYGTDANGHATITTTYPDGSQRIETYYQDGSLYSITGSAVHPIRYVYGVANNQTYTQEIKLDASGNDTNEWTITYKDMLGRIASVVYPSSTGAAGPATSYTYNQQNQLVKQVDPDGVATLYQYDDQGRQTVTAIDVEGTGSVDLSGSDEVTQTQYSYVMHGSIVAQRTTTTAYRTPGSGTPTQVSQIDVTPGGLTEWQTNYGLMTQSVTVPGGSGLATTTVTYPDNSTQVTTVQDGRTTGQITSGSNGQQIAGTSMSYDAYGRLHSSTDARNGTTTFTYYGDDQIESVTTPAPAGGAPPETTSYQYDPQSGRKILETDPDGGNITYSYWPTGDLKQTGGSKSYSVAYTYDAQGRMQTMTTCPGQANQAVTTWSYDPNRGWLSSKAYANGSGPSYTYTAAGRLLTRKWARGIITTYGYDNAGNLASVSYSDGTTPGVTYGRDRFGEITSVTDGEGSRVITYGADTQESGEAITSGSMAGTSTAMGFDSFLRRTSITGSNSTGTLFSQGYGYDTASRLASASEGTITVAYMYVPNSSLVQSITCQGNGSTVMTTSKGYDFLDRLVSIVNTDGTNSGAPALSGSYTYNAANQRTGYNLGDGSYWSYGYDPIGEVTSGNKYWGDGTPVGGEQFGYAYDGLGNRSSTTINGNAASYAANSLNQYTQRTVPGIVEVTGSASTSSHVTVNDGPVNLYGSYFYAAVPVDNSAGPVYEPIKVTAVKNDVNTEDQDEVSQQQGYRYVPGTPEQYQYDADGNLTQDGRWIYTWDGENRLIGMQPISTVPAAAKKQLQFSYDYMGRRFEKQVYTWNAGSNSYQPSTQSLFLYDGWNCVAETDGSNNLVRSYLWGNDLSGSLTGAGGVGGLVAITDHTSGANAGPYLTRYDGNGNVTALLSGTSGALEARYVYGPFGEALRVSGSYGAENPFQFSTKYMDAETGLSYYGYRYYQPGIGRWVSRDPIAEEGGMNIYTILHDDGINFVDALGLREIELIIAAGPDLGVTQGVPSQWQNAVQSVLGYIPNNVSYLTGTPIIPQQLLQNVINTFEKNNSCCNSFKLHYQYTPTVKSVQDQLSQPNGDAYILIGHGDSLPNGSTGVILYVATVSSPTGPADIGAPISLSTVLGNWNSPTGSLTVGSCHDLGLPVSVNKTAILRLGKNTSGLNTGGDLIQGFKRILSSFCCAH